jgi:hypothetical protein
MSASSVRKFVKQQTRESRRELDERASDTLKQIREIFSNISGLTGVSTPDAVQQYYDTASRYFEDALGRGREDVYGFEPRGISESASVAKGMIDPALDQYSLMNRGGFMSQALNPSVVEVDPSKIFGSLDYSAKGYGTSNPLLDYRDAASQAMIQGRRGAIEQQADFYANNPNVKGLMTYNV